MLVKLLSPVPSTWDVFNRTAVALGSVKNSVSRGWRWREMGDRVTGLQHLSSHYPNLQGTRLQAFERLEKAATYRGRLLGGEVNPR